MAENTLIFADLHLNPFSGKLDEEVLDSLEAAVSKHSPQRMVLAGDTFDLFFDLSHEGERTYAQRLESILDEHSGFVGLAKSIPEIIIIPSQHDQVLIWDEDAIRVLQKGLPNSQTHEYWEHELSNTLIVSGVQLTYDIIVEGNHRPISLTEKLTDAFTEFISSGKLSRTDLIRLYKKGGLSFWYQSGTLYKFIKGMSRKYGCDKRAYYARIGEICKSHLFREWEFTQPFIVNRIGAHLARQFSMIFGSNIEKFAPFYWSIEKTTIKGRISKALRTGVLFYPSVEMFSGVVHDETGNLYSPNKKYLNFQTLVAGLSHIAYKDKKSGRTIYCPGSPKAQSNFSHGKLELEKIGSYILISGNDVSKAMI